MNELTAICDIQHSVVRAVATVKLSFDERSIIEGSGIHRVEHMIQYNDKAMESPGGRYKCSAYVTYIFENVVWKEAKN